MNRFIVQVGEGLCEGRPHIRQRRALGVAMIEQRVVEIEVDESNVHGETGLIQETNMSGDVA